MSREVKGQKVVEEGRIPVEFSKPPISRYFDRLQICPQTTGPSQLLVFDAWPIPNLGGTGPECELMKREEGVV